MNKKYLLIIFVGMLIVPLLGSYAINQASAQGTYTCIFSTDDGCRVSVDNCDEGYVVAECVGDSAGLCIASAGDCVLAEALAGDADAGDEVPLGIADRVSNLYNTALGIGALLAIGIIVYGGVLYTASAGNSSRIDDAKKWIWAALSGLFILFGAFLILNVINPNLTTLEDPFLIAQEEIEAPLGEFSWFDIGKLPGGVVDLTKLPRACSGVGAALLCGDDNSCWTGEALRVNVTDTGTAENPTFGSLEGNVSYMIISGDINKVTMYENPNYGGLEITIDNIDTARTAGCTYQFNGKEGETHTRSCVSEIVKIVSEGANVLGFSLHSICIDDDDNDGKCSNNWGDDVSSIKVTGGRAASCAPDDDGGDVGNGDKIVVIYNGDEGIIGGRVITEPVLEGLLESGGAEFVFHDTPFWGDETHGDFALSSGEELRMLSSVQIQNRGILDLNDDIKSIRIYKNTIVILYNLDRFLTERTYGIGMAFKEYGERMRIETDRNGHIISCSKTIIEDRFGRTTLITEVDCLSRTQSTTPIKTGFTTVTLNRVCIREDDVDDKRNCNERVNNYWDEIVSSIRVIDAVDIGWEL